MFRVSLLHFYAVHGGSGAYLSQPTLTGRFLISSHCQPEHLRRLLPPVTWIAWDRDERMKRAGKGIEWKGQWWRKGIREVISQTLRYCDVIYFFLMSLFFNVMWERVGEKEWTWTCVPQFKTSTPYQAPQNMKGKRHFSVLRCLHVLQRARTCTHVPDTKGVTT